MGFYDKAGFLDYPPVYLLFLWVLGLFVSPFGGVGESIKLIPIFTDLALAGVVFVMAQELGASRWRAVGAAAVVLFNPITWFNSAIWGQADVVGSFFMLLGLRALLRDRRELAAVFAVVAALTKIQLGILGVLVGFVILRRSLAPREGRPDPTRVLTSIASGLGAAAVICLPFTGLDFVGLAGRLATPQGLLTLAAGLVAGLGVYLLVRRSDYVSAATRDLAAAAAGAATVVAFAAMAFGSIASHIINTFGEYPYLTLNAYNPWALVGYGTGNAMDQTLGWIHDALVYDNGFPVPYFSVGPFSSHVAIALAATILVLVAVAAFAWRRAGATDRGDVAVPSDTPAVTAPEAGRLEAEAGPPSEPRKPAFSPPAELRALAVGCLVAVGVIVFLLAGQLIGGLPAAIVGDGLLVAVMVGVSAWAAWRDDRLSIVVALAILAIAFFVVPTRAHERYLFPFFAVGAILLSVSWRWTIAYVVLALANTANLLAVLVEYKGIPTNDGWLAVRLIHLGTFLKSAEWAGLIWPIALSGIVMGLAFLWALTQMRTRAGQVLTWETDRAGREPERLWALMQMRPPAGQEPTWEAERAGRQPWTGPEVDTAAASTLVDGQPPGWDETAGDAEEEYEDYEDDELTSGRRPEFVPGFVMRAWHWLNRPSTMPDRSASLATEPRGRFDKLDIWVVVALVAVILSMRVYRLDEPAQMHFDEVYHARTATEFLQDWRYGIRLQPYEWTHPMLAKYAIAGGLVVFSDDKVTATSNLGVTVKDAVVQPRITPASAATPIDSTDPRDNPDARLGDRLYVATGDAVVAYDLQTRAVEATYPIPGATTLSIAFSTGDLYVGTSDGRIWRIDMYQLDDVRLGADSQPAPATTLSTQTGFPIAHLYADSPPFILAVDATGTIVSVDGTGKVLAREVLDGTADFAPMGSTTTAVVRTPTTTPTPTPTPSSPSASGSPSPSASPAPDVSAEAQAIASALGMAPEDVAAALSSPANSGLDQVLNLGTPSQDQLTALQQLIDAGQLPDIAIRSGDPQAVVAYTGGVGIIDVRNLTVTSRILTSTVDLTPATSSSPALDISAEAQTIALALGQTPHGVETVLSLATGSGHEEPIDLGTLTLDQFAALRQLVAGGQLPDIAVRDHPATSIAIGPEVRTDTYRSYVATGDSVLVVDVGSVAGTIIKDPDQQIPVTPGPVTKIVFDDSTKIAQALGRTPDGSGWTVYSIETNGGAVFSDAKLPFDPVAIAADATPDLPNTDRQDLLAVASNGDIASVDIGQFAFAWRIVGVLFGALMAVCLYLLARLLFRRRSVGLLVALFSCVDGMLFAQSRIAMNDTYVGGFLLLAYLVFAYIWLGAKNDRRSWLTFWIGMPLLGVVLGLALASKWVALYAIASIGILIFIRSALGRLIAILGLVAGTGILGWNAIAEMQTLPGTGNVAALLIVLGIGLAVLLSGVYYAVVRARTTPDKILFVAVAALVSLPIFYWGMRFYPAADQNGGPDYTFFLIMLVATAIAAAANAYHPIAWTRQELVFGIVVPALIGIVAGVAGIAKGSHTLLAIGAAGIVVPGVAFWVAGRLGFGPLAAPPGADDPSSFAGPPSPAPEGWLRLGSGFGLPAAWMAACLLVLPIAVYIALYIPWAVPWQPETTDSGPLPVLMCWHTDPTSGACTNAWPVGHTGQTLMQLTESMYAYHNDLRATHAASSPWWAWPLDLKPVWFESVSYGPDLGSWIHDGGNPVLWWMAIPALAFVCWQAFKRRSLGLALIAIAFFWQWLSWARIDRAAFQYHFYTALPFFLLGLAYFLAELWHGPSRRTWLLARVAAVAAAMVPAALWVAKYPLCGLARVSTTDYFGNTACGSVTGTLTVEARIFLIALVLVAALAVLALTLIRLERRASPEGDEDRGWIFQLILPVAVAGVLILWLGANGPRDVIFQAALPPDLLALVMAVLGICLGILAITARDSRRLVLALCIFAVVTFVALYPDLSALPMPNLLLNVYDAILPTWFYGFQFADNMQPSQTVAFISSASIFVSIAVLAVALMAGYAALEERRVNGYRRRQRLTATPRLEDGAGGDSAGGAAGGTLDEPAGDGSGGASSDGAGDSAGGGAAGGATGAGG
jgi:hypothetical protein